MSIARFSFFLSFTIASLVTAQYLPNTQALTIKELEHLYLDAAPNGFLTAITPCSNYIDPTTGAPSNTLGRQTAAEWIRTAFRKTTLVVSNHVTRLRSTRLSTRCSKVDNGSLNLQRRNALIAYKSSPNFLLSRKQMILSRPTSTNKVAASMPRSALRQVAPRTLAPHLPTLSPFSATSSTRKCQVSCCCLTIPAPRLTAM